MTTAHPDPSRPHLRLHGHCRSSASYRVRIVLAHKDLPFESAIVATQTGAHTSPEYLARNPLAQVPVLEITEGGNTIALAQSLAIAEFIEERYPHSPLLPRDRIERARARELAEIVNSGTQPLQNAPLLEFIKSLQGDEAAWARRAIRKGLEALEARARTTAGAFLVGELPTLADVCLVPQMLNARKFAVSLDGLDTLVRIDEAAQRLPRWEAAHPSRQPDAVA